jgi:hypothetical protein
MTANGTNGRWTRTLNPLAIIWTEVVERYAVTFGLVTRGAALLKTYALAMYVAGIAGVIATPSLRRRHGIRILLLLTGVYFAGLCVFNQKLSYYLVHIVPFYVALLAALIMHLWSTGGKPVRLLAAAAVAGLILVETAGIVAKARQRSYIAAEQKVISFVKANTGPNGPIMGTAALLYGFDFDPRLLDDMYLGLRSGRTPQAIIVDEPLYQHNYSGWLQQRPDDMKQILHRLGQYRLAYNDGNYKVYLQGDRGTR